LIEIKLNKQDLSKKTADHKTKTMYALKNKVQLIGNLGNVPEIKTMEGGKKLVRFSVATNEVYRNAKGEKVTETQWHTLVAWGKVADIVEKYLSKGSEVAIEGKLLNRSYTDKQGVKKYITEVQVAEVLLLGEKSPSEVFDKKAGLSPAFSFVEAKSLFNHGLLISTPVV
jgi:single-strand DNA-binding protein